MINKIRVCFYLFLLIIIVSCERLNTIKNDGYMNYHGRTEQHIYFETKNDIKPFLDSMVHAFGNYDSLRTTATGKYVIWNESKITELPEFVFRIVMSCAVSSYYVDSRKTKEHTVVTFMIVDTKDANLIGSKEFDVINEKIENIIDASLN